MRRQIVVVLQRADRVLARRAVPKKINPFSFALPERVAVALAGFRPRQSTDPWTAPAS
jgi:hypothetical protein